MTDKVQKIREEVVRMHNLLPVMDGDNISVNYADKICTTLEMYIDSMQEEPKKCMYSKDNYTDEERKVLCKDCEEECEYAKKEPVSEDLDEAKRRIASEYMEEVKKETGYKDYAYWNGLEKGFELGANWQKKKEQQRLHSDENLQALAGRYAYEEWDEDLVEVARDSFIDGYNICKQQMMKDAVEAEVYREDNEPEPPTLHAISHALDESKFKFMDKVRVIIIKDE